MKIYAAYGSNTNDEQMRKNCPGARKIGVGKLKDYKIVFRGKGHANIEKLQNHEIPVVLWFVDDICEKYLDIYEEYPNYYTKIESEVIVEETTYTAFVYIMTKDYANTIKGPDNEYYNLIYQGYIDNNIPISNLEKALNERTIIL